MKALSDKILIALLYLALAVTTFIAFEGVLDNEFVSYDDYHYIVENDNVTGGLTLKSMLWAFTSNRGSNWHPITWLSHMADCELFGLDARGHHLMNLLIHIISTLLLFRVLKEMTGGVWRSFFVAAAFALHPLRVESVAWAAERKDVLSVLFFMLTLIAYLRYTRHRNLINYLVVVFTFVLGLMAKSMLVTLPFVLLLLDIWPLKRFAFVQSDSATKTQPAGRLIAEKLPLFLLAAVSGIITFVVQRQGGAMQLTETLPFQTRLSNALVSYSAYIGKILYPVNLTILYPHPAGGLAIWKVGLSVVLLVVVTLASIRFLRTHPYLFTGWWWYLVTLIPVIGLIQVGNQAMADRYTYLPSIGILIIVVWGIAELAERLKINKVVPCGIGTAILILLIMGTRTQTRYWQNSITLFERALAVTENNYTAHNNYGAALRAHGRIDEAIPQFRRALEIKPDYTVAHCNMAWAMTKKGDIDSAIAHYRQALRTMPDNADIHSNLAVLLGAKGQVKEAVEHFRRALELQPDNIRSLDGLGWLLCKDPNSEVFDPNAAVPLAERAAELTGYRNASILATLASAYTASGQFEQAKQTCETAMVLAEASDNKVIMQIISEQLRRCTQAE